MVFKVLILCALVTGGGSLKTATLGGVKFSHLDEAGSSHVNRR